jgi:hypothetical protein
LKYADAGIDLIVVVGSLTLDFVLEHGQAAFPRIPTVFTSISLERLEGVTLPANFTGIKVRRDIRETLDLALKIHPDTQQVVVPAGSSAIEKAWTANTRELLRPYEARVRVTCLSDLSMSAMLDRLKQLPPHTLVLVTPISLYDATQRYFLPHESLALIPSQVNAPICGTDTDYMGAASSSTWARWARLPGRWGFVSSTVKARQGSEWNKSARAEQSSTNDSSSAGASAAHLYR